jgi:hypothetical protein
MAGKMLDKIKEIKSLAEDLVTADPISENCRKRIIQICEELEIQDKIDRRLENGK